MTSIVDAPPYPFDAVLECELAPGGTVGAHTQESCAELVVILSGAATVVVDGRELPVTTGDAVPVPLGSVLEIRNRSKSRAAKYVLVKAQPGR